MKGLICYYSGTGNTKLACEYIVSGVKSCTWVLHDLVKDGIPDIEKYDIIGFAAWADFLGIPKVMIDYIKNVNGHGKPAFVFNTFGNINGRTLLQMCNYVKKQDFSVIAGHSLHTPENVPMLIVTGMTREDAPYPKELEKFNTFIENLNIWCKNYGETKKQPKSILKFSIPDYLSITFPRKTSSLFIGKKQIDTNLCTNCGLCVKLCPYHAISLKENPIFDEKKCNGCWVCYNKCPQKAIYTKKYRGIGHYTSPNAKIKEKLRPKL